MPTALIWGASGGLGQAFTQQLKADGWQVFAAARAVERVLPAADLIAEFEANSEQSIQQVVYQVAQHTPELDLMIYSAGGLVYDKLDAMPLAGWVATFDSNVKGAFLAARHSLPLLVQGGHMIFIGAYSDHLRLPKMGAYAAAKAALAELVAILAKENRRHRFTLVRPGAVHTPFWEQVTFKRPADAKAPQQVAAAVIAHHLAGNAGELNL